jgi:hypothetical protein
VKGPPLRVLVVSERRKSCQPASRSAAALAGLGPTDARLRAQAPSGAPPFSLLDWWTPRSLRSLGRDSSRPQGVKAGLPRPSLV